MGNVSVCSVIKSEHDSYIKVYVNLSFQPHIRINGDLHYFSLRHEYITSTYSHSWWFCYIWSFWDGQSFLSDLCGNSDQVLNLPTCFPNLSYFAFKSSEIKYYLKELNFIGGSDPYNVYFIKNTAYLGYAWLASLVFSSEMINLSFIDQKWFYQ